MVPTDPIEVIFDALAYGGEAVGRLPDGRAVFAPFLLPGETARVRLQQEKPGFARAEVVELLQPATSRITPRCKHFGVCGGCHYQHMPYEMQLQTKTEILQDQLRRIGKLENPPVLEAIGSPQAWNYRNQVQFHFTPEGKLGYVRASTQPGRPEGVFAVEECHLPQPEINEAWPQMGFERDSGIERVTIRGGAADELMLVLEGTSGLLPEVEMEAGLSVVHVFEDDCVVLAGEDHITLRVLGRDFRASAPAFFQVNTPVAEKMVEHVLEAAPDAAECILDVYCGVGLFAAFLAPRCKRLIGVEAEAAACEDFGINLDEFDHVELYEAPAEQVLPALDAKPELIVVDPPRAGLGREVLDEVRRLEPERIIYVSCDPATLGRDVRRLCSDGYRLKQATPFDMFPQTYHIESISILQRE